MVSLKKYLAYSFVFLSFLLLATSKAAAGIPCCKNGKMSTCPDLPNGQQYDVSGCQNIDPIRPPLGPIDPIDPDDLIIDPIVKECTSGATQNKYTPSGCSYTTQTRTCCSDGTWSGWDAPCLTTKTCPTSSKPSTKESCYSGYRYRTVTCNKSTGEWVTGSWGDCDCSDSAYESVSTLGGGTCCQRKDGTELRCDTGQEMPGRYHWVEMGIPCRNKIGCGIDALPECNESMNGVYWSKWINDNKTWVTGCGSQYPHINGLGYCQEYLCRE